MKIRYYFLLSIMTSFCAYADNLQILNVKDTPTQALKPEDTIRFEKVCFKTSICFGGTVCRIGCPIGYRRMGNPPQGYMDIVDENHQIIQNAIVWTYINNRDSVKILRQKDLCCLTKSQGHDSSFFKILGKSDHYPLFNSRFLVQAKGYSDVVLDGIVWVKDSAGNLPVLRVMMYRKKYLWKEDVCIGFKTFREENFIVSHQSDSLSILEYTDQIRNGSYIDENNRRYESLIRTFPNPVLSYLFVEFKTAVPVSHKAVLTDLSGKVLQTVDLSESKTSINMEGEIPGIYLISVYNSEGELMHRMKIVRMN